MKSQSTPELAGWTALEPVGSGQVAKGGRLGGVSGVLAWPATILNFWLQTLPEDSAAPARGQDMDNVKNRNLMYPLPPKPTTCGGECARAPLWHGPESPGGMTGIERLVALSHCPERDRIVRHGMGTNDLRLPVGRPARIDQVEFELAPAYGTTVREAAESLRMLFGASSYVLVEAAGEGWPVYRETLAAAEVGLLPISAQMERSDSSPLNHADCLGVIVDQPQAGSVPAPRGFPYAM